MAKQPREVKKLITGMNMPSLFAMVRSIEQMMLVNGKPAHGDIRPLESGLSQVVSTVKRLETTVDEVKHQSGQLQREAEDRESRLGKLLLSLSSLQQQATKDAEESARQAAEIREALEKNSIETKKIFAKGRLKPIYESI